MKTTVCFLSTLLIFSFNMTFGQWSSNGNDISNSNTGNVGIGNNSPLSLLYVGKNMTEPTITVRNLGGAGGASFRMWDNASAADWKFKATNTGGFKIRDNANGLDVITIESNSAANLLYIGAAGNIGIGTATPAPSAAVDIASADKGWLLPRLSLPEIQAIALPADGLQVYCTDDNKIYIFVQQSYQWKELAYGSNIIAPDFICGVSSLIVNHLAGNVAPVNKTVTYGTVTNVPGEASKCWITKNLGADQQALYVDDDFESAAGWYWQFNRMQGYKHDGIRTPSTAWIGTIQESSDWIFDNDPCSLELGPEWRIPTHTEWDNVRNAGFWNDWDDPWDSLLKMHAAGYLNYHSGNLVNRGVLGNYWSSSQNGSSLAISLNFSIGTCNLEYSNDKSVGYSLRCLKD